SMPAAAARDSTLPSAPEPEIETLVDQVCQGSLKAAQDLARIGAPTVPRLMARFPGPVVSERAGPSSRASECGPLLQALANIGSPAVPDIMRSSEDQDERVRRWATLLLGEMPGPEACQAVVQRLADEAPRVHQAALDAARLLLSSSAANLFRKTLFEVAEAESASLTLRLRTLEHVARLRDSASVPRLIHFLGLDTEAVVHKALWVLSVITRQDFGRNSERWWDWWHAHQGQHRLEWLIESLDHADARLRKAAADELLLEARDSFGFSENAPREERLAAQARYVEWWRTLGARRFGRSG
ncbi:MAG TPA: HEAT repeat domain-containing protein, partial [Polyangiaceae bacterium]|nr:HEAT repeat domain-containing protein [Polyangiaceae bacterium]